MSQRVKELASQYQEFSPSDLAEVKLMILMKILAAYERFKFSHLNGDGQNKIAEITDVMIDEYPEEAYQFGKKLFLTDYEVDNSVKSASKIHRHLGINILMSPRLSEQFFNSLADADEERALFNRLFQMISFDLDTVSVKHLRNSAEALTKILALIFIFSLKDHVDSPLYRELYAIAKAELTNRSLHNALYFLEKFEDTKFFVELLKSKLPNGSL